MHAALKDNSEATNCNAQRTLREAGKHQRSRYTNFTVLSTCINVP